MSRRHSFRYAPCNWTKLSCSFDNHNRNIFSACPSQTQDSPQTTLLRSPLLQSFAMRITRTLLKTALQQYLADCPAYIESPPPGRNTTSSISPAAPAAVDPTPTNDGAKVVSIPIDLPLLRCHRPRSPTPQQLASRRVYAGCNEHQRRLHLSALDLYTEPTTTTTIAASKTSSIRRRHQHYRNHHDCHRNDNADDGLYANGRCSSPSSSSSAENIYDVPNIDSDTEHANNTTTTTTTNVSDGDVVPSSPIVTAATPLAQKRSPHGGVSGSCEIYDYDLYYRKQLEASPIDPMPAAHSHQHKHHGGHKHHKHHHHHHHQHDHHKNQQQHRSTNHLLEIRTTTSAAATTTTTTSSKKNLLYSPRHYPPAAICPPRSDRIRATR